ncbi:MAG: sulfatase-like hydrolase/transferase, partial [bacterium]|nr:sulfatase-like hydrolase/transferase [bacterium]
MKRSDDAGRQPLSRRQFLGQALAAGGMIVAGARIAPAADSARRSAQGGAPARRPNILILHADQHNARVLGCAGHPDVKTPNLDKLAAEGMRFERAYCQDAICVPSRTSLMTGLYPRTTGVLWNSGTDDGQVHPGVRVEPMAAWFKAHGYRTGAFGRRHLWAKTADTGWDVTCTTSNPKGDPGDTEYYYDWVRQIGQWDAFDRDMTGSSKFELNSLVSELTPDATQEAWASRKAIDFIRQSAAEEKPFFCWVPYLHPHQPYT